MCSIGQWAIDVKVWEHYPVGWGEGAHFWWGNDSTLFFSIFQFWTSVIWQFCNFCNFELGMMHNNTNLQLLSCFNPHTRQIWESLILRGKLAVWAMFFPFKEHKPYQGTLGSLEVILIGSRIRPSPSMDPTGTLKWTSWFSRKIQAKIPFVPYTLSSLSKHFGTPFLVIVDL